MHKTIQLLSVQAIMHSYTCAASTVKDLKYVLFLNIFVQSYLGTTEIAKTSQLKKIFKHKAAKTQAAAAIISAVIFF